MSSVTGGLASLLSMLEAISFSLGAVIAAGGGLSVAFKVLNDSQGLGTAVANASKVFIAAGVLVGLGSIIAVLS